MASQLCVRMICPKEIAVFFIRSTVYRVRDELTGDGEGSLGSEGQSKLFPPSLSSSFGYVRLPQ